jgi:hypothetical protein
MEEPTESIVERLYEASREPDFVGVIGINKDGTLNKKEIGKFKDELPRSETLAANQEMVEINGMMFLFENGHPKIEVVNVLDSDSDSDSDSEPDQSK